MTALPRRRALLGMLAVCRAAWSAFWCGFWTGFGSPWSIFTKSRNRTGSTVAEIAAGTAEPWAHAAEHRFGVSTVKRWLAMERAGDVVLDIRIGSKPVTECRRSEELPAVVMVAFMARDLVRSGQYTAEEVEAAVLTGLEDA